MLITKLCPFLFVIGTALQYRDNDIANSQLVEAYDNEIETDAIAYEEPFYELETNINAIDSEGDYDNFHQGDTYIPSSKYISKESTPMHSHTRIGNLRGQMPTYEDTNFGIMDGIMVVQSEDEAIYQNDMYLLDLEKRLSTINIKFLKIKQNQLENRVNVDDDELDEVRDLIDTTPDSNMVPLPADDDLLELLTDYVNTNAEYISTLMEENRISNYEIHNYKIDFAHNLEEISMELNNIFPLLSEEKQLIAHELLERIQSLIDLYYNSMRRLSTQVYPTLLSADSMEKIQDSLKVLSIDQVIIAIPDAIKEETDNTTIANKANQVQKSIQQLLNANSTDTTYLIDANQNVETILTDTVPGTATQYDTLTASQLKIQDLTSKLIEQATQDSTIPNMLVVDAKQEHALVNSLIDNTISKAVELSHLDSNEKAKAQTVLITLLDATPIEATYTEINNAPARRLTVKYVLERLKEREIEREYKRAIKKKARLESRYRRNRNDHSSYESTMTDSIGNYEDGYTRNNNRESDYYYDYYRNSLPPYEAEQRVYPTEPISSETQTNDSNENEIVDPIPDLTKRVYPTTNPILQPESEPNPNQESNQTTPSSDQNTTDNDNQTQANEPIVDYSQRVYVNPDVFNTTRPVDPDTNEVISLSDLEIRPPDNRAIHGDEMLSIALQHVKKWLDGEIYDDDYLKEAQQLYSKEEIIKLNIYVDNYLKTTNLYHQEEFPYGVTLVDVFLLRLNHSALWSSKEFLYSTLSIEDKKQLLDSFKLDLDLTKAFFDKKAFGRGLSTYALTRMTNELKDLEQGYEYNVQVLQE